MSNTNKTDQKYIFTDPDFSAVIPKILIDHYGKETIVNRFKDERVKIDAFHLEWKKDIIEATKNKKMDNPHLEWKKAEYSKKKNVLIRKRLIDEMFNDCILEFQ